MSGDEETSGTEPQASAREIRLERVYEILVVLPAVLGIGFAFARSAPQITPQQAWELSLWIAIVAVVELIPVPVWRGTQISMGFPLLMVVAFLYPPSAAALAAFLAASDPRELRREVNFLRALFNRCQVSLAVWAASGVFQALASVRGTEALQLVLAATLAAVVDYCVNFGLVTIVASLHYHMPPFRVVRELRIGRLTEFLVSYLGLAGFGLILAKFFVIPGVGFWSVPVCVLPLLLARQMFFRSKALEEAHKELQDREQVLRALSNRMAEERQDERAQIAAFLHDDLAQLLFKLSLQVDIARRHLAAGKLAETEKTLEDIKETKAKTSDRIRALIRDLHRSPLGRAGLAEALQSFIAETGRDAEVTFRTDIDEVPLPPPIALLLYHIAREGVMNALKHADPSNVWLTVKQDGDAVEMVLRDDGHGFDPQAPAPEGHYGLTMMRERALVGGGTFALASAAGAGTTITVRFPTSWLQEGESGQVQTGESPSDAFPGTPPDRTGQQHQESVVA